MAEPTQKPRLIHLADLIERDIRQRGLRPGDQYLTAAETARMLSSNTSAVNRALQLLVQRGVLERKPRKGACVAQPRDHETSSPLSRVHLLVHQNDIRTEGLLLDGTIIGIQSELPGAEAQFDFMPLDDSEAFTEKLISETLRRAEPNGFVLVRSTLASQRCMARSGLPTVVFGSLFPSVTSLPWIERDHFNGGRMLVEHALSQGCKRIIVLVRERGGPGDYLFNDGIRQALANASMLTSALTIRPLPADLEAISAEVGALLEATQGRAGIIARSELLANGAIAAAERRGMKLGEDISILVSDFYRRGADAPPALPHLVPTIGPEGMGAHIGRMLAQQARGERVDPNHEIISQRLVLPDVS
ncbi:MAG TPA: substrate-binding domain-containing protein [Tepidisphaeraceae bacterium]|nr:substrate-binding domain-containing protein [Tepidisphaeraceae bacterium]